MMKRSRRSLGLLLASMALWLLVLRATTLPARKSPPTRQQGARATSITAVPRMARAKPTALPTAPTVRPLAHVVEPERVFTCRHVSMIAVIIVLPQAPADATTGRGEERQVFDSARHTGWSGCMAYSNGCDHLGRTSLAQRCQPGGSERLLFAALRKIVRHAMEATASSAEAVCLAASASQRGPNLASDWVRPSAER